MRYTAIFLVMLFPVLSSAFQLDWSGYYKAKAGYIRGDGTKMASIKKDKAGNIVEGNPLHFYGEQQLALYSTARVSDGLQVRTNFLVGNVEKKGNYAKYVDSSRYKISVRNYRLADIYLLPTHFYATYSNEFFKLDIGRQPFNFGLGITYSDGFSPLLPMYDVRDAVAVTVEYDSFYLKPYAIVYNYDQSSTRAGASFAAAGGYKTDNITAEILYKSKNYVIQSEKKEGEFEVKPFIEEETLNVYGEYKEGPLTVSAEWGFMDNVNKSSGFGHASWQTDFYNANLNLIGGYISNNHNVNPNYDNTLFTWDYFYHLNDRKKTSNTPQNTFLLVPYITFDVMEDHNILLLHAWVSDQDTLNFKTHDLLLIVTHTIADGFSWANKFGTTLKGASVSDFAIVTEAIIKF